MPYMCYATRGPSWGHPMVVLGTIRSYLEPLCGHLSPKNDKVSGELTLRYPHEGPCVVRSTAAGEQPSTLTKLLPFCFRPILQNGSKLVKVDFWLQTNFASVLLPFPTTVDSASERMWQMKPASASSQRTTVSSPSTPRYPMWHTHGSPGQILALALRQEVFWPALMRVAQREKIP